MRWSAACHPMKVANVMGHLTSTIPGLMQVALPQALHPLPYLLASMHVPCCLLNFALAAGFLSRVDESLLLSAADYGFHIGAGLIYSTSEVLDAVLNDSVLPKGHAATRDRVTQCAALSFRWDSAKCSLSVREGSYRGTRAVEVHMSRQQLIAALQEAHAQGCMYVWCDTLCIPQPSVSGDRTSAAALRKRKNLQALLPVMTAVYAASKMVLVVQTSEGAQDGPNRYSNRTWTLQECVMNGNTRVVSLDGEVSGPVDEDVRSELSGIGESDGLDLQGMSNISGYKWVLPGEELQRAKEIPTEITEAYAAISNRRTGTCSDDKAMALGQVIFRVLFPQEKQSIRFFQELVWLHATELSTEHFRQPLMLIDNTGWKGEEMTGSASPKRLLAGRVGVYQTGPQVEWNAEVVSGYESHSPDFPGIEFDDDDGEPLEYLCHRPRHPRKKVPCCLQETPRAGSLSGLLPQQAEDSDSLGADGFADEEPGTGAAVLGLMIM